LICIGRKAHDYFYKRKFNVIDNYSSIFDNLTYASAEKLAENLIDLYIYNKFDRIIIIYNRFKNAAMQELSVEQFLPLDLSIAALKPTTVKKKEEIAIDYIFEPSQKEILSNIIPNYLKIYFFRMLLDSNASEHGARMTAMHIATDNASEILKQLRLSYNKARQASITKELLEIVTGAEALKG
jgi:F-type H+-transporting ATPase subunit gamma